MEHENINFQIQTGTMLRMAENQSKLSAFPKESEEEVLMATTDIAAESQECLSSSHPVLPVATPTSPVATSPIATAKSPEAVPPSPVATSALPLAATPEGDLDSPDAVWRQLMERSSASLAKQVGQQWVASHTLA